jgi:ribosomal protein L37AE/L43A
MGAEKKSRNEILSRIAADLFEKSKGGDELSSKIQRLRDEIRKVIESEDTVFGKFRELVDSFEIIIPDEKQRYNAAIQALSTTSKLSRQEIVKAVNNQLEELKILEKGLMPTNAGWRDELKVMESRSRVMRDEIAKLREKMERLESEEKEILNGIAAREKEVEVVEKSVGELFADIGTEIASIKKRVEELTVESAAPQPIAPRDSMKSDIFSEDKGVGGQKSEIPGSSEPHDQESQKTCPMCGGRMNFHSKEKMWLCYSCAYEELNGEKGGGEQRSEIREPSAPQDTEFQKKCPMCGGRMNFHSHDEMWICYSCAYEESEKDGAQVKSEVKSEQRSSPKPVPAPEQIWDPSPHFAVPLASMTSNESQKSKKGSSPSGSKPSGKKKPCPVCHKKMDWYETEKAWRCRFCDYERRI